MYDEAFSDLEGVTVSQIPSEHGTRHARHLYTIRLDLERLECDRMRFIQAVSAENIGTGIHFVPVHLHRHYRKTYGTKRGDYPNAERIGDRTLSLPLSASMSEEDARDVIAAVTKVARRYARSGVVVVGSDAEDGVQQAA